MVDPLKELDKALGIVSDVDKLQKELAEDEGCKYEIYNDHLGYATFGIGHLVTDSDLEYGQEIGTEVSKERVVQAFESDLDTSLRECGLLYGHCWSSFPSEVKEILVNMMFNLGYPRLSAFRGMKAGVDARDWHRAANEMVDSRWYNQVPNRAKRLVNRMRSV